jgi:hypothetical protein
MDSVCVCVCVCVCLWFVKCKLFTAERGRTYFMAAIPSFEMVKSQFYVALVFGVISGIMSDIQVARIFVSVFKGFMVKREAQEHNDSVGLCVFMVRIIMLNEYVFCLHHRGVCLAKGAWPLRKKLAPQRVLSSSFSFNFQYLFVILRSSSRC